MRADIYRFAGDPEPAMVYISTLADRGLGTLHGELANNDGVRDLLSTTILPELSSSDHITFTDAEGGDLPDMELLKDRFEDATGGVHPGHPTIRRQAISEVSGITKTANISSDLTERQLSRFYELTGMRRRKIARPAVGASFDDLSQVQNSYGGSTNKLLARVQLPEKGAKKRSMLHELGHCGMPKVGLACEQETEVDPVTTGYQVQVYWGIVSNGLKYVTTEGRKKGSITEEAVAEGLGTISNRKLGIARAPQDQAARQLPDMVAPYISGNEYAGAAPSAVALELIAQELDIPSERYFRMFVDYANVGVQNSAAREEVAETIYRGTRGRLTLAQIEELPYPIHMESNLALLWAVEDALDVPEHQRYADLFS